MSRSTGVAACRICLSVDVRLLKIAGTPLQHVYEKLTNNSLHAADERPIAACYVCHALLKKSYGLLLTSIKAENLLVDILKRHSKITEKSLSLVDRTAYGLGATLVASYCFDDWTTHGYDTTAQPCGSQPIFKTEYADDDNLTAKVEVKIEKETEDSQSGKEIDDIKIERETDEGSEMVFEETESSDVVIKIEQGTDDAMVTELLKDPAPLAATDSHISNQDSDIRSSPVFPQTKGKRRPGRPKSKPKKVYKKSIPNSDRSRPVLLGKHYTRQQEDDEIVYTCTSCGATSASLKVIKQHIKEMHLNAITVNQCPMCKVTFNDQSALKHHLTKSHGVEKVKVDGKYIIRKAPKFECHICNTQYTLKSSLNHHNRKKHKIRKCPDCDVELTEQELANHRSETHNYVMPKCGICGYTSYMECKVVRHQREVHLKEKDIPCPKCDAKFYSKTHLKEHMLKHDPVRNFECAFCGKNFLRLKHKKMHEKIHTGDKGKVCGVCGARFVQKAALNYHMTKHHPEAC